jgi:hypothetical protein
VEHHVAPDAVRGLDLTLIYLGPRSLKRGQIHPLVLVCHLPGGKVVHALADDLLSADP